MILLTEALDTTTSAPVTHRLSWRCESASDLSPLAFPATLRALSNLSPFGCGEGVIATVAIGGYRRGHCSAGCAETTSLGISSLEVEVRVGDELVRRALSVACYFSTAAAERRIAIA